MHREVLLAYLLADPELSLQSILISDSVIGRKKTTVYVVLGTIFSTLTSSLFGGWLEGGSGRVIAAVLFGSTALLIVVAACTSHQASRSRALAEETQ